MATSSSKDSKIVLSILKYLQLKKNDDSLTDENKESLDVSIMCLQEVFGVDAESADCQSQISLEELFETTPNSSAEPEELKSRGNTHMKENNFEAAIDCYSQAIKLDSMNATYYANRAAAYMKTNNYSSALSDCEEAVRLNPKYAKVYMRMGMIHSKLNATEKAKENYKKAVELEPDNVEYKTSLESIERQPGRGGGGGGTGPLPSFDPSNFAGLMNNPMFMNLASNVMSNPAFQNVASSMFQSSQGSPSGQQGGLSDMMPHFAQMAQQMQQQDPEGFESIRNQMSGGQVRPSHDDTLPPEEKKK